MTLLSDAEMMTIAQEQYREHANLRRKDALIDQTLYRRHQIHIPPSMAERARPIYANVMGEKLHKARVLLSDPRGPQISVTSYSASLAASQARDRVQNWLTGGYALIDEQTVRPLYQMIAHDLLVRSRAYTLTLPNAHAWDDMPSFSLDGIDSLEEQKRRQRASDDDREAYRRRIFPIRVEWVPALGFIPIEDWRGLCEGWDFRTMPVREVLEKWVDTRGTPLASRLATSVKRQDLTLRDVCTVVTRADREHMQIAVLGMRLDSSGGARPDARYGGSDELVWAGPHGMPDIPYAAFPGRETVSDDPVERYAGFLDDIEELSRDYDEAITQLASSSAMVAWPSLVLQATKEAGPIGTTDKNPKIALDEGGVTRLPPGYELKNPQWTNAQDFRLLETRAQTLLRQIDLHTITAAAFGTNDASSGYLQNQLESATKQNLDPYARGLSIGYSRTGQNMLCAARALLKPDHPADAVSSIPVRQLSPEGVEWVSLQAQDVKYEYIVTASVRVQPVGGKAAAVSTHQNIVGAGWEANEDAMTDLGDRNPTLTMRRIKKEQILNAPEMTQAMVQAAVTQLSAATRQQAPAPREGALVPPGLAPNLTNPELRARIPGMPVDDAGLPPLAAAQGAQPPPPAAPGVPGPPTGGNPNGAAESFNRAPPAPPTTSGVGRFQGHQGGRPPGSAQQFPGGVPQERDRRR